MSHPAIKIFGYSEATMYLRQASDRVAAIISIHGAREFGVEAPITHRLDLHFVDIESPTRTTLSHNIGP